MGGNEIPLIGEYFKKSIGTLVTIALNNMTITCSEWVRTEKVNQLYGLIKAYNGRTHNWYLAMPTYLRDRVYLTYSFDCSSMFNLFSEDWNRLNTNIVEKTRKKSWRVTLRNFWFRHF